MPETNAPPGPTALPGPVNPTWAIFLVSVLGLYLEMLLIRWIGTEISIFAYLQNTVLVVCFLGLGLGCFTCRQPVALRQVLLPLLILVLLLAVPWSRQTLGRISELLSAWGDLVVWHYDSPANLAQALLFLGLGLVLTYFLMVLILDLFVPLGRLLGRLMDDHPRPIWAYSVNVAGSLAGVWLFVLLSALHQPPFTWFVVLAGLLAFFLHKKSPDRRFSLVLLLGLIPLSWWAGQEAGSIKVLWSPYQKLALREADPRKEEVGQFLVKVNNTGYQTLIDLTPARLRSQPRLYPPEMHGFSQYDIPLLLHPRPRKFLVVGAGAGNDVAAALRHGAEDITAVEIDPAIISLGRRHHPERPYAAPGVRLVADDARSFFAGADERYDLISFGLLDSHTTTAMTNARLDHYVYTIESLARAKSLLAPGGVMVLSFEAQKPYITDRMAGALREVFQQEPLCFRVPPSYFGWGGVTFVVGDLGAAERQIAAHPGLTAHLERWRRHFPISLTYTTRMATDDWPYIYLASARIPLLYYLLAALMALLLLRSYRHWHAAGLVSRWRRGHWHFFFLGAAFLLLEVQNISKAAVVLGNTWEVNAVIVSGVLAMILVANLWAARGPRLPLPVVYAALCGVCLGLYFFDLSRLAFLPYAVKAPLVGALTTLPMLFSGLVFIRSFAQTPAKDEALGANLMGALVGALLQSLTFVTGIKALLLLVTAFYGLALLTRPATAEAVRG